MFLPLYFCLHTIKNGHLELFGHLCALIVELVEEVAHNVCVVKLGFGGGSKPKFLIKPLGAMHTPAPFFFVV